ncbi:MAG: response regulator [bacterium]|nr:response regulator [bacterium]
MDKKKILLVEDDPFISEMYTTKFERAGYDIEVGMTGKEGLMKAREWMPDILLLDILIPEMDGFEVLSQIKKDPATSKIPVVMLTNLGQKEDIEKGTALGAAAYVIKAHFTPQEVVDKVKSILGA